MTVFNVPTSIEIQNYIEELVFDAVEFRLSFKFNDRDSAWYMDILNLDDVLLRAGIKLITEFPLLVRWQSEGRPAGELVVVPNGSNTEPPLAGELGQDAILTYLDAEEVESVAG